MMQESTGQFRDPAYTLPPSHPSRNYLPVSHIIYSHNLLVYHPRSPPLHRSYSGKMMKQMEAALGTAKPFSSVSVWVDRLSADSYAEDDYEG